MTTRTGSGHFGFLATEHAHARFTQDANAYACAAARGDILPVILRLAELRHRRESAEHLALVEAVGPSCQPAAIDRACALMRRAPEIRLLRAAASLRHAAIAPTDDVRGAFLASAAEDLHAAIALDPTDPSARSLASALAHAQRCGGARAA